ncbi:MAG: hypothetical protein ABIP94_04075 [Planctomycetota bacterium]
MLATHLLATASHVDAIAIGREELARISEGLVVVMLLATLWVFRAARREGSFAPPAQAILRWMLLGLACWALEPLAERLNRSAYFVANAAVAASFFAAGRALLVAEQRLHRLLRSRQERRTGERAWTALRALLQPYAVVSGVTLAIALSAAWSIVLAGEGGVGEVAAGVDIADLPSAIASALGMVMLGLGLFRELTRERYELVGTACGLSVVVYGCLQPLRVVLAAQAWLLFAAILLKVAFLLAIASFWTLVREMARAQREEAARWQRSVHDASRKVQVAADLHDIVLGRLHAIRMLLGLAQRGVGGEIAVNALADAEGQVGACSEAVRSVIDGLPALELARGGLRATLQDLLQSLRARTRLETKLLWEVDAELPTHIERTLAAIAIEAAHNVERHANARSVVMLCRNRAQRIVLVVEDDGKGMPSGATDCDSYGLRSMRTRATAIGAAFRLEQGDAGGVRVVVEIEEIAR